MTEELQVIGLQLNNKNTNAKKPEPAKTATTKHPLSESLLSSLKRSRLEGMQNYLKKDRTELDDNSDPITIKPRKLENENNVTREERKKQ